MPICPNCCSPLKRRNNSQGKYYHCTRHGFVRDIGTPERDFSVIAENESTVNFQVSRPIKIKMNMGAQNA